MQIARRLLAFILCFSFLAFAQGNSWDRVRYNGGSLNSKVNPKDWNNHLSVTSDVITFKTKDGQVLEIPTKSVTGLSYGQEAHRRVGTMVALAILVAPVALFGLFHKTRLHYIGIEFKGAGGKGEGILLQGDKDNYRAILLALHSVTGAKVAVSEKDRGFIPVGVEATVVKEKDEGKGAEQSASDAATKDNSATGTISLTSTPDGADVSVDGAFLGNTPATLKLPAGKHSIKVSLTGHKDWKKDITVLAGSEIKLTAILETQN